MLLSTMCFNCKATSTNDTNYSCHTKAVKLVTPLVVTSLGGGHTDTNTLAQAHRHTHTHTHTHIHTNTHILHGQDQFQETRCMLACGWRAPGLIISYV